MSANFFDRHRDKIAFAGPDHCWLWTASKRDGYGQVWVSGASRPAHRVSYESFNGEGSAAGLIIRHRCDTPACVNPAHLELGTHADNARDRDERGRQVTPTGEANGNAKLTTDEVVSIRSAYARGCVSQYALARRFGVDRTVIGRVVNRKLWAHVG